MNKTKNLCWRNNESSTNYFNILFTLRFQRRRKTSIPPPSKKEVKKEEVKVKETKFERNQISPEEITKILESYTINNKANIDEESLSSVKEILNKLITVLLEKDIKEFTNMIEDPLPYDFESKFEKEELETKFLEFKEKPASKFKNLEETFRVQGEFVYYKEPEKELYKFLFLEGEIQLRKGGGDIMSYSTFPKAVRNSKLEM
ncbi:MAG: hypothetical protein KDK36_05495, partial [Leptospiraceae bacterium]|nr:hypothetical protein [Leptospiraceae bacterium]